MSRKGETTTITEEHIKNVQAEQRGFDENKRKLLLNKRVISLRLNDYASQSGRRIINSEKDHSLYKLVDVLRVFARENRNKIISSGNKYLTEKQINKIIEYDTDIFSTKIGDVLNFYKQSLIHIQPNVVGSFFFFFIQYFLDSKEKEFGINYKFNFYKDVYVDGLVKIKQGIYKLERLSSLHEGKKISVSKLTVNICRDHKGKNVFNDSERLRLRFVENKKSEESGIVHLMENKGRIVIRNNRNYVFMGIATHMSDTGNPAADKKRKEKTIQIMSFQLDEGDLYGVVLDTSGASSYTPFAARVRATYLASNDEELEKMGITDDDFKTRSLYGENKLINKNDEFFVDDNKSLSTLNGFLTAF